MNSKYTLVDPLLFVKEDEYLKQLEEFKNNKDSFPHIYFKVNDGKYQNWFFRIENAQLTNNEGEMSSVRCTYTIVRVPNKISDEEIYKDQSNIDKIIHDVFQDILEASPTVPEVKNV